MKIAALAAVLCVLSAASNAQVNSYKVTPIVNNTQDPFLVNPWGMSRPIKATVAENEWWTSDSFTGFTTLYYANQTGSASLAPLVINVPSANGVVPGSPTGTAYNPGVGPGPTAENFTFATLDGLITNWNAGQRPAQVGTGCYQCHTNTTNIVVNRSTAAASYTGLTFAINSITKVPTYYAANHNGGVEAYNANTFARITLAGTFSDPKIPSGYKPYGIQAEGSFILVTYFNDLSGGFVDAFDTNGNLKGRLSHGSWMSEPWAVALAPANFGAFSNMLLVGNTTSGRIAAFDTSTGAFKGFLEDATGAPIVLPGLWGIGFGNGNAASGPTNTLYYAAGGNYTTGEFGAIAAN
jgi:uncharacterized protein (TIGR03118 family)